MSKTTGVEIVYWNDLVNKDALVAEAFVDMADSAMAMALFQPAVLIEEINGCIEDMQHEAELYMAVDEMNLLREEIAGLPNGTLVAFTNTKDDDTDA